VNDPAAAKIALVAAGQVCEQTSFADQRAFASEDFAFMLRAIPGAYLWLGQGSSAKHVQSHHPAYDFNDAITHVASVGL
jgi:hippurate hydrolase